MAPKIGEALRLGQRAGRGTPIAPSRPAVVHRSMLDRPRDRFILLAVLALMVLAGEVMVVRWL